MSKWEYQETELWRHGEDKIALYHVFGLIAAGKAVLAFSEAREGNGADADCVHSIHMRRSTDGGKSFGSSVCLYPGEKKSCWTNPVPVYDAVSKRLFLFISDNQENRRTKNYVVCSDDLGETWSSKRSIQDALENGPAHAAFHLAGPGHGIQITGGSHDGRLAVPFWHRSKGVEVPVKERGYCISMLYSDDHGETWQQTDCIGQEYLANESRIGQTADGLIWLIRSGPGNPCKYICKSCDGGDSWTKGIPLAVGAANCCDAGLACLSAKADYRNLVLLSRVSRLNYRRDMEILISPDGGNTFPERMQLPPGDAMPGYSDLCVIEEEEPVIGLLHCRENHVLFSRISMQTLTGGRYEHTQRTVWTQ